MLDILEQFIAYFLPRTCVGCGFNSNDLYLDLCTICKNNLPWIKDRCYQCGAMVVNLNEAIICANCQELAPPFNRLCCLFSYQQPIIKLVSSFKFGRQLYPGKLFARLMLNAIRQSWYINQDLPQVIIPVPLHMRRHRSRGYNQAIELCKPIAAALDLPLDLTWCHRIKYTQAQARLNKEQRINNVKNAFIIHETHKYKYVALVDDVVTTGSTVWAISLALHAAGVDNIDIWCIARA